MLEENTQHIHTYIYTICMDVMYLCYQMFFKHNLLQASSELCTVTVQLGIGIILVQRFTVDMFTVHPLYYDRTVGLA